MTRAHQSAPSPLVRARSVHLALALLLASCGATTTDPESSPDAGEDCGEWSYRLTVHAPAGKLVRFMAAPGHEGTVRFRPEGYDVCSGVECLRLSDGATARVMVSAEGAEWLADEGPSDGEAPGCPW